MTYMIILARRVTRNMGTRCSIRIAVHAIKIVARKPNSNAKGASKRRKIKLKH